MSDGGKDILVRRQVLRAALELMEAAGYEGEAPAAMAARIVGDCRRLEDETAHRFWSEVQEFVAFAEANKIGQLWHVAAESDTPAVH